MVTMWSSLLANVTHYFFLYWEMYLSWDYIFCFLLCFFFWSYLLIGTLFIKVVEKFFVKLKRFKKILDLTNRLSFKSFCEFKNTIQSYFQTAICENNVEKLDKANIQSLLSSTFVRKTGFEKNSKYLLVEFFICERFFQK